MELPKRKVYEDIPSGLGVFERQDVKAMQIDSLHVGKPNSLFNVGEVMLEENP